MNDRDLAVKFEAYAHYLASHEWVRERSTMPKLVYVAQEGRMHRVAQSHSSLRTWTATEVLLAEPSVVFDRFVSLGVPHFAQNASSGRND